MHHHKKPSFFSADGYFREKDFSFVAQRLSEIKNTRGVGRVKEALRTGLLTRFSISHHCALAFLLK